LEYAKCGIGKRAAVVAGYSEKSAAAIACRTLASSEVQTRLNELTKMAHDQAEHGAIMSIQERLLRLSEIARGRVTDYQQCGADGGWINVGPETPNSAAISEIVTTTKYDDDGAKPVVIARIRLHNPVQAIDLLNKMDGVYKDEQSTTINNQVLIPVYQVVDAEHKELLARVHSGERTMEAHPNTQG